jgi:heme/copper-type cytochrome/quinol oxidase subunit 2
MLESSWVAAQLEASQEGLSSMKFIIIVVVIIIIIIIIVTIINILTLFFYQRWQKQN